MNYLSQSTQLTSKRPQSVTFIGWLFLAAGIFGIAYHSTEFKIQAPFDSDLVLALFVRLLAIVGGVFLLRGANWARWLLVSWMAYHVILSTSHSVAELVIHIVLFVGITYFLLRPRTSQYFRDLRSDPKQSAV